MNTILLEPTDVLFFRDGRPMGGASSGQGAAWPLPNVLSHAFHAALHRAAFEGVHRHVPGRSSDLRDHSGENRERNGRLFGSLATAGPFPVLEQADADGEPPVWYFPRPADAGADGRTALFPADPSPGSSSLPSPLRHPVCSSTPPTKETLPAWMSRAAWDAYLGGGLTAAAAGTKGLLRDGDFADTEHHYGIAIDPSRGSVEEGKFYSAHYLRLRPSWRLGVLSSAWDKDLGEDLVAKLLNGAGREIVTGGQQRVCTAKILARAGEDGAGASPLPLPTAPEVRGRRVKWILLSAAIWPRIEADLDRGIREHLGGWLPSWVCPESGCVLLRSDASARRPGERREAWRARVRQAPPIAARLVAASTGKPLPVTGYATASPHWDEDDPGGAKSIHLAVPAGSVYYFEAEGEDNARRLADALNWHGSTPGTAIRNRRSALMGEKGFGLGVCGNWEFLPGPSAAATP